MPNVVERARDYLAANAAESGADVLIVELVGEVQRIKAIIHDADTALCNLLGEHGWATGHGDTIVDLISEVAANVAALSTKR